MQRKSLPDASEDPSNKEANLSDTTPSKEEPPSASRDEPVNKTHPPPEKLQRTATSEEFNTPKLEITSKSKIGAIKKIKDEISSATKDKTTENQAAERKEQEKPTDIETKREVTKAEESPAEHAKPTTSRKKLATLEDTKRVDAKPLQESPQSMETSTTSPPSKKSKQTAPVEEPSDFSESEIKKARKESEPQKFFSKVADKFHRRRSSTKSLDADTLDTSTPKVEIKTPTDEKSGRKLEKGMAEEISLRRDPSKPTQDSEIRRKSSLKHPDALEIKDPVNKLEVIRKRSSIYNPFESFEKHVSLAAPVADGKPPIIEMPKPAGSPERRLSEIPETGEKPLRRTNSLHPTRQRSVSVVDLTKKNIAICFFPEEPDWDDEDDEEDEPKVYDPRRRRSDSLFPDPKTPYDWTQRERWHSRLVYIIALVTYSISFSNIYHFPALVYQLSASVVLHALTLVKYAAETFKKPKLFRLKTNCTVQYSRELFGVFAGVLVNNNYGGIPFLIPYTIFTIIMGYPLHFLESSLGQYSQSGPVRVWDAAPIARGVGWSMFLLCLVIAYYYNMYAAYSVIYFSRCFNSILPWQDCDEPATSNYSCVPRMCARPDTNYYTPAEHYFFHHVLQIRQSAEILGNGLGPMVWTQVIGFFLAWIIVYAAIIQSVRSIGKVVFFLVVLPYFVLLMLLTAGFMLEGSSRGLKMLFGTNFNNLLDIQVWRVAAEQVFFELGICQGTPLAYGSYCHHRNLTYIDSGIICLINYCTSMLCATVIFLILGALSMEIGAPVPDVIHRGPGIVFIAYPEALSRVPGSHIWCIMFFLMLFSVAIGTQIAIMETVMTVVYDEFNNARPYRWLINFLICFCLFLLGIILCTCNGYFVVHLLDRMTGTMPRLPIAVCMVGTIVLIYGISKFCEDMHFMLGYYPNLFIRFCLLITPLLLLALTIPSWVLKTPLTANHIEYSKDAIMVGWFTIWFILIWIVLGALYWIAYCYYIGELKGVFRSLNSWGPRNFEARIARTEFSSEDVSNFTKPWTKKAARVGQGEK